MNEPAAYLYLDVSRLRAGHCADKVLRFNKPKRAHVVDIVPLYPKQPWVGLTDDEVNEIYASGDAYRIRIVLLIEAAFKEKNT